ncbi:type VI secretion system secreted protein VgrG, partial [Andreprevotia lacus DSM 23236]
MSRTLSVASPAIPLANGEPTLVPTVVRGRDGINQLHQYDITLITPDTVNPEHFLE